MAVAGDAVTASTRNLGHEAVAPHFDDQAWDPLASSMGLVAVRGGPAVETGGESAFAEAADGVFAGHDGSEQGKVVGTEGD